MVLVRYHCWWPGSDDPYYNYNITEARARVNYYGADYTPHLYVDGNIDANYNYSQWETRFVNEADVWSTLVMDMTGTYDPDALAGHFVVNIFAEFNPGASNMKLRVALVENDISWRAPNGTQMHNQTFRDMIPSAQGVGFSIMQGESFEYESDFTTPSPMVPDNLMLIAFVQSDLNRNILQGARVAVPDLTPTDIDEGGALPMTFGLAQNYPNPFNATTKISFDTPGGTARLDVFDLTGAKVRTLVDGDVSAGTHSVIWDGTNDDGEVASSGVYFYRLNDSNGEQVMRMTLLK